MNTALIAAPTPQLRIVRATEQTIRRSPRVYYATEGEAHAAARVESRTCPLGLFVEDDHNGFFVTPLGRFDHGYYFGGEFVAWGED